MRRLLIRIAVACIVGLLGGQFAYGLGWTPPESWRMEHLGGSLFVALILATFGACYPGEFPDERTGGER